MASRLTTTGLRQASTLTPPASSGNGAQLPPNLNVAATRFHQKTMQNQGHTLLSNRRTTLLPLRRHVLCRQVQTHHGLQLF